MSTAAQQAKDAPQGMQRTRSDTRRHLLHCRPGMHATGHAAHHVKELLGCRGPGVDGVVVPAEPTPQGLYSLSPSVRRAQVG